MNLLFEKQVDRDVSIFVYDTSSIDVKEIIKYGIDPELINSKRKLQTELYKYLVAKNSYIKNELIVENKRNELKDLNSPSVEVIDRGYENKDPKKNELILYALNFAETYDKNNIEIK